MTTRSQSQPALTRKPRFGFVLGIVGELRKVVWPTRQETMRLTAMVIVVCAAVGIVLGLLDFGFAALFNQVLTGGR